MITIKAQRGLPLVIGFRGENKAHQVEFDISEFVTAFGDGVAQLIFQRPQDSVPYPCVITRNGNTVVWTITDTETAQFGNFGMCELSYHVDDVLAKSETWQVIVKDALGVPSDDVPEPYQDWLDQVIANVSRAEAERIKAEEAANASEQSAQSSANSAIAAEHSEQETKKVTQYVEQCAEEAKTSKDNAKQSEINASKSAEEAEVHAENAVQSEQNAATSVTVAKQHKDEAVSASSSAKVSETNAKTSEQNAVTSATLAEQYKEDAVNASNAAKVSEDNAKTSEINTNKYKEVAEQARQGAEDALQRIEETVGSCVSYLEQDKSDEEKAQARKNIDAVKTWDDVVDKPFRKTEIGDTLTWDGNTDGLLECDTFYRVFPFVEGIVENIELFDRDNVTYAKSNGHIYTIFSVVKSGDSIRVGGEVIITLKDDAFVPYCGMRFPKKGVYFYGRVESGDSGFVYVSSFTVQNFNFTTEKMNEEILPDTVVQNGDKELMLTSPNGSLFRITVDNNGTISAAQVTN